MYIRDKWHKTAVRLLVRYVVYVCCVFCVHKLCVPHLMI